MRYILFTFLIILFASCSKDGKQTSQQENAPKNQVEDIDDNPNDTNLTPEEKFSSSIMIDFLDNSDDDDLGDYLETEIYKMGANYTGASVVELNPSTWLVMLEKDGAVKNYLLQKFVEFSTSDYYFKLKETPLTVTDVVARSKVKTVTVPAGQ
jgi:hypothetical protein